MFEIRNFIVLFALIFTVSGITIIEKERHFNDVLGKLNNNDIDDNDEQCSNLSPDLIKEIKAHQPLVDSIVNAIVKGKYSGDTWNA